MPFKERLQGRMHAVWSDDSDDGVADSLPQGRMRAAWSDDSVDDGTDGKQDIARISQRRSQRQEKCIVHDKQTNREARRVWVSKDNEASREKPRSSAGSANDWSWEGWDEWHGSWDHSSWNSWNSWDEYEWDRPTSHYSHAQHRTSKRASRGGKKAQATWNWDESWPQDSDTWQWSHSAWAEGWTGGSDSEQERSEDEDSDENYVRYSRSSRRRGHDKANSGRKRGTNRSMEPRLLLSRRKKKTKRRRRKDEEDAEAVDMDPAEREAAAKQNREELSQLQDAEPSFDDEPLELLRERATLPEEWQEVISDSHLRCWMYLKRADKAVTEDDFRFLRDEVDWEELVGVKGTVTRKTAWMVRDGCQCQYKYGKELVSPEPFPTWMDEMMKRWLQDLCLAPDDLPNSVNLNLYENGTHAVGWHADDEPLFQGKTQDARFISVSLGTPRRFRVGMRQFLKKKKIIPAKGTVSEVLLEHGDVCTMEGLFQKHFLHQIARSKSSAPAPRVNATFRWIVEHAKGCPLHIPTDSTSSSSEDSAPARPALRRRKLRGRGLERPAARVVSKIGTGRRRVIPLRRAREPRTTFQ